jgi:Fur family peroxide stress response transcriptional regulator
MDDPTFEILKNKGIRLTPQRLAICGLIFDNKENHPSAEDIFQIVKEKFPTISLATVYKTFSLLKNENLISEIPFGTFSRFDPKKEVHINIICPNCKNITDFENDLVNNFYNSINNDLGGGIIDQQFTIFKKCNSC